MAVDDQAIRDFVAANIGNPQAIADAAQANGVSVADIASAMSLPVESVNTYFSSASVPPPVPETQVVSVVQAQPTALSTSQPTTYNIPGVTDQQISVLKQYSPEMWTALQTGNAKVTQSGGQAQIVDKTTGQPFDTSGLQVAVLPNNQLSITGWGGKAQQVGATTSIDPSGNVAPLTDQNISRVNQYGVDYGGITLQQVIQVGLAYALPIVGEAIAAEISVPASVGTALAAVGTGVAQGKTIEESIKAAAPSLIASGIMSELELGKLTDNITKDASLQNVINNVANSTVSTALKGGSATDIFNNAIASGGGTLIGQSLTPDLGTYGASTVGQALATGAVTGSGLAGLTAGASTAGGLQATQNAYNRDIESVLNAQASGTTPQKVSLDFVDLSQGTQVAGPGGLPNNGFQPGQMTQTATGLFATLKLSDGTIVNVPVQYNQGSISLTTNSTNPEIVNQVYLLQVTPENISKINPVFLDKTPINPNITPEEQAALNKVSSAKDNMINALKSGKSIDEYYNTYAYQQSLGDFANQIAEELAKDPTGTDPSFKNLRDEYQKITGSSFTAGTPVTDLGEIIITGKVIRSDPTSNTSTIQTPDGVTINVNSVLPQNSSVAVNKTTSQVIPTSVTNQTAKTDTSPVSTTDTTTTPTSNVSTSNVTITSGGTNNASNIKSNVGSNLTQDIINLLSSNVSANVSPSSNVTITSGGGGGGGGDKNVGNVTITGGTGNNIKNNIANVTITGGTANNIATVISSEPSANVTITGGGTNNAVSNVSDNNVSITTSYVPTKTKTLYPTIVGQFASPVTQAVSAYRPPGDIESQATGKEREDVWNTESLRNALGI